MNRQQMIWVALGISVILNAGFAGFVIARMSGGRAPDMRTERMAPEMRAMAAERMRQMGAEMNAQREEMRAKAAEMRAAQHQAAELLRQNELNEEELRETFAEIRRLRAESELVLQEALINTAREMDARERQKLARYVERRTSQSRRDRRRQQAPEADLPPKATPSEDNN